MIQGIIKILKDHTIIQALVGENTASDKYKVYPGICPQPEKPPFLVVRRTGRTSTNCKGQVVSLYEYSFDVIIYHKNYKDLDAIEEAVDDALDGVSGTYEGVGYKNIRAENAYDAEYIKEWSLHARVMEFNCFVNASTIT